MSPPHGLIILIGQSYQLIIFLYYPLYVIQPLYGLFGSLNWFRWQVYNYFLSFVSEKTSNIFLMVCCPSTSKWMKGRICQINLMQPLSEGPLVTLLSLVRLTSKTHLWVDLRVPIVRYPFEFVTHFQGFTSTFSFQNLQDFILT